jgi:glycosyltransferase A (GT-A) superfamily protein (DUF2064 family)
LSSFGRVTERAILVMAKSPIAGRVKTRLCPPCTPDLAAAIAEAALVDTLRAALATGAPVVMALEGPPGAWLPSGIEVVPQWGTTFADRLRNAWSDFGRGGLQIGMDTPQVPAATLRAGLDALDRSPSALGRALDGGWWALALRTPHPDAFHGIAMSCADTGSQQWDRLCVLGLAPHALPQARDIDTWDDATAVARDAPDTLTAAAVASAMALVGDGR